MGEEVTFRQFIIALIIIAVLFVMGPLVAAAIVSGGMDWVAEFFRALSNQ